jgi:hypothetical protein
MFPRLPTIFVLPEMVPTRYLIVSYVGVDMSASMALKVAMRAGMVLPPGLDRDRISRRRIIDPANIASRYASMLLPTPSLLDFHLRRVPLSERW